MQSRPTIKDVARDADVSIKTVSNVISRSGSMRPETRQRVEKAVDDLGYSKNICQEIENRRIKTHWGSDF